MLQKTVTISLIVASTIAGNDTANTPSLSIQSPPIQQRISTLADDENIHHPNSQSTINDLTPEAESPLTDPSQLGQLPISHSIFGHNPALHFNPTTLVIPQQSTSSLPSVASRPLFPSARNPDAPTSRMLDFDINSSPQQSPRAGGGLPIAAVNPISPPRIALNTHSFPSQMAGSAMPMILQYPYESPRAGGLPTAVASGYITPPRSGSPEHVGLSYCDFMHQMQGPLPLPQQQGGGAAVPPGYITPPRLRLNTELVCPRTPYHPTHPLYEDTQDLRLVGIPETDITQGLDVDDDTAHGIMQQRMRDARNTALRNWQNERMTLEAQIRNGAYDGSLNVDIHSRECPICIEELKQNDIVRKICNANVDHWIHSECWERMWSAGRNCNRCPVCRFEDGDQTVPGEVNNVRVVNIV